MPELTSRSSSSSGDASAASTIRARLPSPSRTIAPVARAGRAARRRARCRRRPPTGASRRAPASSSAVSAGTSPFSTSTSPVRRPRAPSRAERTASPVPSGVCWIATSTPSNSLAVSGEATTTTRSAPALRAPRRSPSRPCGGRAAGAGASASRSSCACRGRRPLRLLRDRSASSGEEWLGRQDSNLGSRDQNPLPYRLATPHQGDGDSSDGR